MKCVYRNICLKTLTIGLAFLISGCKDSRDIAGGGETPTPSTPATPALPDYSIFLTSGYPVATGTPVITEWTRSGNFIRIVHDYSLNTGFQPQNMGLLVLNGVTKIISLAMGTAGRLDYMNLDGSEYNVYIDNTTAMAAGTRRLTIGSDGSIFVARSAGAERFNSAKQRVGTTARYAASGTCSATAVTDVSEVLVGGVPYVITNNAAATPNNKLNLYNGATGACIAGAVMTGPDAKLWPVSLHYSPSVSKLFVMYYPFTAAPSNAQIWSFDVSATAINGGTLVYDDVAGDIAIISTAPQSQSGDMRFYRDSEESFLLVGTTINSVLKLDYDANTGKATNPSGPPLIYGSVFSRTISGVLAVPK